MKYLVQYTSDDGPVSIKLNSWFDVDEEIYDAEEAGHSVTVTNEDGETVYESGNLEEMERTPTWNIRLLNPLGVPIGWLHWHDEAVARENARRLKSTSIMFEFLYDARGDGKCARVIDIL